MILKTALKIFLFQVLIYIGWYVFSFVIAWLGIFIIVATVIGYAAYFEKQIRNKTKQ